MAGPLFCYGTVFFFYGAPLSSAAGKGTKNYDRLIAEIRV